MTNLPMNLFCEKQCKAALARTSAVQGTSRKKNFMALDLESLKSR